MLRGGGGGEEGEIEAGYGWRVGWEGKGCAILRVCNSARVPVCNPPLSLFLAHNLLDESSFRMIDDLDCDVHGDPDSVYDDDAEE